MTLLRLSLTTALLGATFVMPSSFIARAQSSAAITTDPAVDKAHPAAMQSVQIPSHGELLNGLVYLAAGVGPHPVVVLLHGFPGNERNLDLAQAIRRAGWDVVFFDYRGSWGTPGVFSFTHSMEDAHAVLGWLREPATAERLHADPAEIVLIGHSMGGMIAAVVGSEDAGVRAVGMISTANMAGRLLPAVQAGHTEQAVAPVAKALAGEGIAPLAGCTAEGMARELLAHAAAWNLPDLAAKLAPRPVFLVTSDDGLAPANDALAANLAKAGDTRVTNLHLATDHSYSDHRIALEQSVLGSLATLKAR